MSFQSIEGAGSGAEAEGSGDEGGDVSKKTYEEDAQVESRARWRHVAGEKVRKGVDLVALPRSDKLLYEALLGSRAFTRAIDPATYRIFLYNAKTDGECKTQPKIRLPVLRAAYMHRVVHAALRARNTENDGVRGRRARSTITSHKRCRTHHAKTHERVSFMVCVSS